ncbi:MAG: hypothetical protein JEZ06_11710 [Anaerolineaceae bacterium]|nr:hypothetical protein [Anaerolineaceae bacterium]
MFSHCMGRAGMDEILFLDKQIQPDPVDGSCIESSPLQGKAEPNQSTISAIIPPLPLGVEFHPG